MGPKNQQSQYLTLRVPASMERQVRTLAAEKATTINRTVVDLLESALGAGGGTNTPNSADQARVEYMLVLQTQLLIEVLGLLTIDDPTAVRRLVGTAERKAQERVLTLRAAGPA